MIDFHLDHLKIQNILEENSFFIKNPYLYKVINKFSFQFITKDDEIIQFVHKKCKFNIIIIDKFINTQNNCKLNDAFIVYFDYIVLLIESSKISLLLSFFLLNKESMIYCISDNVRSKLELLKNESEKKHIFRFSEEDERLFI